MHFWSGASILEAFRYRHHTRSWNPLSCHLRRPPLAYPEGSSRTSPEFS